MMGNIRILDCTLRDGGWVNQFRFGSEVMQDILHSAEKAGAEFVELGYLDLKNGAPFGESRYCSFEAIRANALDSHTRLDTVHCVMIDCGKYPAEEIPDRKEGSGIDAIRLCFHKDAASKAIRMGREILRKGYGLLLQPMVTTRYSDEEFRSLIEEAQSRLPEMMAFYIVDSFGVMNREEVARRVRLADQILRPGMVLGVHLHNNRDLAFANAMEAMRTVEEDRPLMIDCTLSGIGKGAGNMRTEDFAEYLNMEYGKAYDVELLCTTALRVMDPLKKQYHWGSHPSYALTARYRVTPTYADLFYWQKRVSLQELERLLIHMPEEKKDSFDREFALHYLETMTGEKG